MTDEDLLNTDLVITGRDGFRLNLDSPEWRGAKRLYNTGRVISIMGGVALAYMLTPQLLSLFAAAVSSVAPVLAITIILFGVVLRWAGDRSMTNQIMVAVHVVDEQVEA